MRNLGGAMYVNYRRLTGGMCTFCECPLLTLFLRLSPKSPGVLYTGNDDANCSLAFLSSASSAIHISRSKCYLLVCSLQGGINCSRCTETCNLACTYNY